MRQPLIWNTHPDIPTLREVIDDYVDMEPAYAAMEDRDEQSEWECRAQALWHWIQFHLCGTWFRPHRLVEYPGMDQMDRILYVEGPEPLTCERCGF